MENKNTQQQSLHIGHLVKAVFDESGLTVAEFAKRIHCDRTNVYKIFARQSLDTELLVKISKALQHNFFVDVMNMSGLDIMCNLLEWEMAKNLSCMDAT